MWGCACRRNRRSASCVDAMVNGEFAQLTRKHGIKVGAGFPCSVEDIGLAVGEVVGHGSVKSAARMNSAVVLFLDQVEKVNRVVETGLTVNGMFVQVLPLILPATRITLSNVPPFITDEFLSRELSRHGKIVSPMKKILSGFKSPLMKHVVSHRRHIYMILNNREAELNLRFHVKVDDYDYVIFASSSVMKCFGCGVEGHTVRACPGRGEPAPPGPGGAAETPAAPPVAAGRGVLSAELGSAVVATPTEGRAVAGPSAVLEGPIASPCTAVCRAAVCGTEDGAGVHNGEVEVGESEVSVEELIKKYKKMEEQGMGEENIETRSGGEKNVKEVSEISKAQGKPAEVEVGERGSVE